MYDLNLTKSHAPAQSKIKAREITIGALLREVAALQAQDSGTFDWTRNKPFD